ncbi:MAG: hypothetical protein Kow0069_25720 [Promethearchaeota archaeon]
MAKKNSKPAKGPAKGRAPAKHRSRPKGRSPTKHRPQSKGSSPPKERSQPKKRSPDSAGKRPRAQKKSTKRSAKASPAAIGNQPVGATETWWAAKWIDAVLALGQNYRNRLPRGKSYAESGAVVELDVEQGRVTAKVLGTFFPFYDVEIRLPVVPENEWPGILEKMSRTMRAAARLVCGEMPEDVERAFDGSPHSLFPRTESDLTHSCTCPDYQERSRLVRNFVCKHVAAVHFELARVLDADPFLLFELRGMDKKSLMGAALGGDQEDAPGREEPEVPPAISDFFGSSRPGCAGRGGDVEFSIGQPLEGALPLSRGVPETAQNPSYFKRVFKVAYERLSRWAVEAATEESEREGESS